MRRYGVPEQILTDNGKVFSSRFGPGKGEVLFDRICRENGIRHLLTAPHSPTTTGKVERFHKTRASEFLSGRVFACSRRPRPSSTPGWPAITPSDPTRASAWSRRPERFALAAPELSRRSFPRRTRSQELRARRPTLRGLTRR